jgi:hypothetical protein
MQSHAPTIYAYAGVEALLEGEERGGNESQLPASLAKQSDGKSRN